MTRLTEEWNHIRDTYSVDAVISDERSMKLIDAMATVAGYDLDDFEWPVLAKARMGPGLIVTITHRQTGQVVPLSFSRMACSRGMHNRLREEYGIPKLREYTRNRKLDLTAGDEEMLDDAVQLHPLMMDALPQLRRVKQVMAEAGRAFPHQGVKAQAQTAYNAVARALESLGAVDHLLSTGKVSGVGTPVELPREVLARDQKPRIRLIYRCVNGCCDDEASEQTA